MFGGIVSAEDAPESLVEARRQARGLLQELVSGAVQAGQLRGVDTDALSFALWSLMHGMAMDGSQVVPGGPRGIGRLVESSVQSLLAGADKRGMRTAA